MWCVLAFQFYELLDSLIIKSILLLKEGEQMREMSWDKELGQVSLPCNQMNNSDQKKKKIISVDGSFYQ